METLRGIPNLRVLAALILAQTLLGGYTVIGKFGIKAIDPVYFALIRESCAAPILLCLAWFFELRNTKKRLHGIPTIDIPVNTTQSMPKFQDLPSFLLLALTGVFGNQLFFILGLSRSDSITAAIIQPLAPIWTVALAILLKIENISRLKLIGIFVAVIGSLITLGLFNFTLDSLGSGSIFFLLNTGCMGAYFLFQKPVLKKFPPITTTALAYTLGAFMMAIATMFFSASGHLKPLTYESFSNAFWPLVYTILGPSIGAYLLIAYANQRIDSTIVSSSKTLQPIWASILAYFVLGERLLPQHAIGALFLITGMVLLFKDSASGQSQQVKEHGT